jgi:tripartite-type tricarboxylate transporter receptor subunit TctC
MIVPFPAGGPSDVVPRILGDEMRGTLGQGIIVENAGGSVGMGRVARAAADGYTAGVGSWSSGVVNGAIYALNYDVVTDSEPVVLLPENPLFITSTKAIRANSLVELIAWVKGAAGRVLVATSGVGTSPHRESCCSISPRRRCSWCTTVAGRQHCRTLSPVRSM